MQGPTKTNEHTQEIQTSNTPIDRHIALNHHLSKIKVRTRRCVHTVTWKGRQPSPS